MAAMHHCLVFVWHSLNENQVLKYTEVRIKHSVDHLHGRQWFLHAMASKAVWAHLHHLQRQYACGAFKIHCIHKKCLLPYVFTCLLHHSDVWRWALCFFPLYPAWATLSPVWFFLLPCMAGAAVCGCTEASTIWWCCKKSSRTWS